VIGSAQRVLYRLTRVIYRFLGYWITPWPLLVFIKKNFSSKYLIFYSYLMNYLEFLKNSFRFWIYALNYPYTHISYGFIWSFKKLMYLLCLLKFSYISKTTTNFSKIIFFFPLSFMSRLFWQKKFLKNFFGKIFWKFFITFS